MDGIGNYSFLSDILIAQWGATRWKKIQANMAQFLTFERVPHLDGFIYYDTPPQAKEISHDPR